MEQCTASTTTHPKVATSKTSRRNSLAAGVHSAIFLFQEASVKIFFKA